MGIKQLVKWQGQPLVRHMARRLIASRADEVLVVVGFESERVAQAVSGLAVEIVDNPHFANGQSTSLRAGLQAVRHSADAVLFVPCDQPNLSIATFNRLIAAANRHPKTLVNTSYPDHRGAPTVFPRTFFPLIAMLTGDTGGREILRQHPDHQQSVEVHDTREGQDMDSAEDYERLRGLSD